MNWRSSANCASTDPEIFFPITSGNEAERQARSVCSNCVVKHECLDEALQHPVMGIWGGTNESERASLRSKNAKRRHQEFNWASHKDVMSSLGLTG